MTKFQTFLEECDEVYLLANFQHILIYQMRFMTIFMSTMSTGTMSAIYYLILMKKLALQVMIQVGHG